MGKLREIWGLAFLEGTLELPQRLKPRPVVTLNGRLKPDPSKRAVCFGFRVGGDATYSELWPSFRRIKGALGRAALRNLSLPISQERRVRPRA